MGIVASACMPEWSSPGWFMDGCICYDENQCGIIIEKQLNRLWGLLNHAEREREREGEVEVEELEDKEKLINNIRTTYIFTVLYEVPESHT